MFHFEGTCRSLKPTLWSAAILTRATNEVTGVRELSRAICDSSFCSVVKGTVICYGLEGLSAEACDVRITGADSCSNNTKIDGGFGIRLCDWATYSDIVERSDLWTTETEIGKDSTSVAGHEALVTKDQSS